MKFSRIPINLFLCQFAGRSTYLQIHNNRDMQRVSLRPFSTTDALNLLRQGAGSAYFVPTGYIPVLVPDSDDDPDVLRHLLAPHFAQQVPVDNLWQTRLPTKVVTPRRKTSARPGLPKKDPPRPPNAFILYRKDKQVWSPSLSFKANCMAGKRPRKGDRNHQQQGLKGYW